MSEEHLLKIQLYSAKLESVDKSLSRNWAIQNEEAQHSSEVQVPSAEPTRRDRDTEGRAEDSEP